MQQAPAKIACRCWGSGSSACRMGTPRMPSACVSTVPLLTLGHAPPNSPACNCSGRPAAPAACTRAQHAHHAGAGATAPHIAAAAPGWWAERSRSAGRAAPGELLCSHIACPHDMSLWAWGTAQARQEGAAAGAYSMSPGNRHERCPGLAGYLQQVLRPESGTSETPGTQLNVGLSCIAAVPGMLRPQGTGMHEMSLVLHTHNPTPSRQYHVCQVLQDPPANLHNPVAYSLLPACKLLPHTVLAEQWDGGELPEESVLSLPLGQRCEARLHSRAARKALALECWSRAAGSVPTLPPLVLQ